VALYEYACVNCSEKYEVQHAMGENYAATHHCRMCSHSLARAVQDFQFTEDRRRMRPPTRNAPRPDWSWTLGAPAPQSRAEARTIEKTMGIEFVSRSEALADAQRLREGKDLSPPPKLEKGYLAKEVARRGIRFDRSLSPPRILNREEAERKLKAEQPDWHPSEAKVARPENVPTE
jgi:putative FmdB family regulatory protein